MVTRQVTLLMIVFGCVLILVGGIFPFVRAAAPFVRTPPAIIEAAQENPLGRTCYHVYQPPPPGVVGAPRDFYLGVFCLEPTDRSGV